MDNLTPEQRRKNMRAIKSKGSQIELMMGEALSKKGFRFRRNSKVVFGKPDFSLKMKKLAIFCDSEFWHGKSFDATTERIGTNKQYWVSKIKRNIQRDKEVNTQLSSNGWTVLRFWESQIKKDLEGCIKIIESHLADNN